MFSQGPSPQQGAARQFAATYKSALSRTLDTIDINSVCQAIEILDAARSQRRTIFVCGNGGSAATASHFASDLLKGANFTNTSRFRVMALTNSIPVITAYSNDVAFECIFSEQLKSLAGPGDVLVTISASGNSPNVLRAAEYARSIGCPTIALTGRDGGKLATLAELEIRVSELHMGRIEDSHMAVCHMVSYYFKEHS
jgi:D-sedoheptulose 7-phosphate isomerase